MKSNKLLFLLCLLGGFCFGQLNTFNHQYLYKPNYGVMDINSLCQTYDKGYVFTRGALDTIYGYNKYTELVKVNREGDPMWTKRFYNGHYQTKWNYNTVAQTNTNGLIFGTSEFLTDSAHIVLTSMDSAGNIQWSKKYLGALQSFVTKILANSDSTYLVCGSTIDSLNVSYGYVFKIDINGNYLWGRKIVSQPGGVSEFYSCIEASGGGYVLAGRSGSGAFALKLNSNGANVWSQNMFTYSGVFYNIEELTDGSLICCGAYADSVHTSQKRLCYVKFDSYGNLLWQKGYQNSTGPWSYGESVAWNVKEVSSNELAFAVYIMDPIPTTVLGKMDANGNIQWSKGYRSSFRIFSNDPVNMILTKDGGIAIQLLGGTITNGASTFSSELLKTDANCYVSCEGLFYSFNLNALNYLPNSGAQNSSCGQTETFVMSMINKSMNDTVICENISDQYVLGINELSKNNFELLQNSPNPFSAQTTININLKKAVNEAALEVYDSKGLLVLTKKLPAMFEGKNEIILDLKTSSGIYFYSVIINGERKTRTMLIE